MGIDIEVHEFLTSAQDKVNDQIHASAASASIRNPLDGKQV